MSDEYNKIPEHIMASLRRYADHHVPCGHFLTAVLSGDLFGAIGRADDVCAAALPQIVKYIYNEMPGECWGNKNAVNLWIAQK